MTGPSTLSDLTAEAAERLDALVAKVAAEPTAIRTAFPAAAREVGRTDPTNLDPTLVRVEDLVRGQLLAALAQAVDADVLDREVNDLYRFGDADERRAVLHALADLGLGERARDLVDDALRTNDTRLVAAAMGPAAEVLDAAAWRQGVLKCLFVGVPLSAVARLDERVDDELVDMMRSFAAERAAAGREFPADAERLLASSDPTPSHTHDTEKA